MKTFKITLDDSEIEVLTQLEDTAMLPPADIESAILAGIVNQIRRQGSNCERCGRPLPVDSSSSVYVCPLGWGCSDN